MHDGGAVVGVGDGVTVSDGGQMASLVEKIFANSVSAVVCSTPKLGKGLAGEGLRRTCKRSRRHWRAWSRDEVRGMVKSTGKNSTVSETLGVLVEVT